MRLPEDIDFTKMTEAVVELTTYSSDPDEHLWYEQNEAGVYYPSFIRYGDRVLDVGKKVQIEVAHNGFIVKQGQNTYICENKWELESHIQNLTNKIVKKERDLSEEELEEADLETLTLRINTHFAAQGKRAE